MKDSSCDSVKVQIRSNAGEDSFIEAVSAEDALAHAKQARKLDNHMVCIEVNENRTHRWDRNRIVGSNHWKKTDPDEMEVLGPIRSVFSAKV